MLRLLCQIGRWIHTVNGLLLTRASSLVHLWPQSWKQSKKLQSIFKERSFRVFQSLLEKYRANLARNWRYSRSGASSGNPELVGDTGSHFPTLCYPWVCWHQSCPVGPWPWPGCGTAKPWPGAGPGLLSPSEVKNALLSLYLRAAGLEWDCRTPANPLQA